MTNRETSYCASITEVAKSEKIVDYSFERNDKSNVLAIHHSRPLIAYLINIQRTQKISKAWSSGNDSMLQSPASSLINGQSGGGMSADKSKTVSIRIIDYVTRQRCLAKGIYHARPADCVFTINSPTCVTQDIVKMAVVDRLANIYLYDLSYYINDLTATRIAVIRGPGQEVSPFESISLVWCPFVPCEDFEDGDGGLRLALATDSRIEIFAVDKLQGLTGELYRNELEKAYKCIRDSRESTIVSLSISPDCSTISAAAVDNRVTFFSSDIIDAGSRCLHKWDASMTDSPISRLFFLDDYPKLLEDSTMKFWGAAFIGTRGGQILLIDLRTWTVYQKSHLQPDSTGPKSFDYRIDLTSKNIVAINGNQCYVIQIVHDYARLSAQADNAPASRVSEQPASFNDSANGNIFSYLMSVSAAQKQQQQQKKSSANNNSLIQGDIPAGLPKIIKITRLSLHTPVYSFVIKHRSNEELELFTITAYSLELYIINLNTLELKSKQPEPNEEDQVCQRVIGYSRQQQVSSKHQPSTGSPSNAKQAITSTKVAVAAAAAAKVGAPPQPPPPTVPTVDHDPATNGGKMSVDVNQMDRLVECLFTKLNMSFSQGLDEFLSEVRCEVNDLKSKLNELSRDFNRLQQQMQHLRLD